MQIQFNWPLIGACFLAIGILFVFILAIISLLLHITGKKWSDVPKVVKAEAAAHPQVVVDAEQIAQAVITKIGKAPPVTITNHPALTAVADVVQEAAAKEAALQTVVSAVNNAQQIAQGAKK